MSGRKGGDAVVFKYRLAGAAVLIGFAVIVLPLLLGGPGEVERDPAGDAASSASQSDTRVFRSNITPIGGATPSAGDGGGGLDRSVRELLEQDAPASEGAEIAATGSASGGGREDVESQQESAKDESGGGETVVAVTGSEGDDSAGGASSAAPGIERGWIVQVGTFTRRDNANRLIAELERGGYGPSTTDVETSSGTATRVWVGPYETRVEAARVKTRVSQQVGSDALIVAYP